MGTVTSRYDRSARLYERWWAPVLRPSVHAFLDRMAPLVEATRAPRILDVGTGTGSLAIEALRRWPTALVTGIDGSGGMLGEARRMAEASLDRKSLTRLDLREGLADRLPFDDHSFDLVVSSFVLQLVPDRTRALREARRVIADGGWCGYVSWRVDRAPFEPDAAWGRALDAADAPDVPSEEEDRSGDIPSARSAAAQLRSAGFTAVTASETMLERRWTRRSFLEFLERYDEVEYLASLEPEMRRRIHDAARREFTTLRPMAFVWRTPIVTAMGRRPIGPAG